MKQFPLEILQGVQGKQNQQNRLPLMQTSKFNMDFLQNYKSCKDELKESSSLKDIEKILKAYEDTLSRQKLQIEALKQELHANKEYTIALEQKYTVLIQSIQPLDEKVNIQFLVNKIMQLQVANEEYKKNQVQANSFKFLKLNQKSTSISSQDYDQILQNSQKSISSQSSAISTNFLSKFTSKAQDKEIDQNSISRKTDKMRKQSTDSEIGIQVCLFEQYNASIKKNNIEKFISLQSHLKNNQVHLSRKRKNSQFQENLSAIWDKFIHEHLNQQQAFGTKFKHKTEYLLRKSIPYQLRSTVWPMVFENPLGITWQFYMELLQRKQKGWVDEAVRIQIQKDLNRSFTGKGKQLENKSKLIDEVQQVLQLFHLYRPDISYVQGMTYPAIVLTTVVGKMRAFCILANQIVGIPFIKRLYTFQGEYPSIYCRTFDYLLKDVNSGAFQMLKRKHISSELFLIQWFYTFFSRGLNFETTLKIWDHMAYFGELTIFKLAVTVIELVAPFLNDATYEGAMGLIKEFSSYIDDKKIIDAFSNSKVTQQKYKKAFKRAIKSFQ